MKRILLLSVLLLSIFVLPIVAQDDFDRDDPSAAFTAHQAIKPGKYEGDEAQRLGRQVLEKVEEVNRHWLFTSKPAVESWSYTFRAKLSTGQSMEKKVQLDRSVPVWEKMRGITYFGLAQSLCMEKPKFKTVEVGKDQIKLHFLYDGQESASQRIGNGMEGQWFGFFQSVATEGMLYVDAKNFTVTGVKLPSGGFEKYTDYVTLDELGRVPCRIEVEHVSKGEKMYFDLRFKAYEPGLWLFERSEYKLNGKKTSVATLVEVKVNGAAPKEIRGGPKKTSL